LGKKERTSAICSDKGGGNNKTRNQRGEEGEKVNWNLKESEGKKEKRSCSKLREKNRDLP